MVSNNKRLFDYLPMKHSYFVKHYDKTELLVFQDAIDLGYGDLFIVYKYETKIGLNNYKVLVVR